MELDGLAKEEPQERRSDQFEVELQRPQVRRRLPASFRGEGSPSRDPQDAAQKHEAPASSSPPRRARARRQKAPEPVFEERILQGQPFQLPDTLADAPPRGRGRGRGRAGGARGGGPGRPGRNGPGAPDPAAEASPERLPQEPCVKTQGTRAAMPPPAQTSPTQTSQLPPPLHPGPSVTAPAPGPAAAGLMNLMFADDSQDVSRTPTPKLQSAAEVSKPEFDTALHTAVNNDAPEACQAYPAALGHGQAPKPVETHELLADQPLQPPEPEEDTLPGSLTEVGFEPFRVPVEPVADGPVLQTVSFFDMLKGLD